MSNSFTFESPAEREDIRARGIDKWKSGGVVEDRTYEKEIESGYMPKVSVRLVNEEVGHGLYAEEEIGEGAYVGEYTGMVRANDRHWEFNNYLYEYPVPDPIGRSFVIDATAGNLTRFINHSYTPNLKPVHVFFDGFYHLIFIALRTIGVGEQLCYDYGRSYWYVRSQPSILEEIEKASSNPKSCTK